MRVIRASCRCVCIWQLLQRASGQLAFRVVAVKFLCWNYRLINLFCLKEFDSLHLFIISAFLQAQITNLRFWTVDLSKQADRRWSAEALRANRRTFFHNVFDIFLDLKFYFQMTVSAIKAMSCSPIMLLMRSLTVISTMNPVGCGMWGGCFTLGVGWGVREPVGPTCTSPAAPQGGSPPVRAPRRAPTTAERPWTP